MAKFRSVRDQKGDLYGYRYQCPGCAEYGWPGYHVVPVVGEKAWSFSGTLDCPTLSPSVKGYAQYGQGYEDRQCHHFVQGGKIQYLSDCTHSLAGKTVDLPEIEIIRDLGEDAE